MFVRNFYAFLFKGNNTSAPYNPSVRTYEGTQLTCSTGRTSEQLLKMNDGNPAHAFPTGSSSGNCIRIGSGGTKPTLNDYKLENDISNSFTWSNIVTTCDPGNLRAVHTFTLRNTQTTELTIREYCLGLRANFTGSDQNFLLVRGLFATPITIQPGDSAVVNIVIQYPY